MVNLTYFSTSLLFKVRLGTYSTQRFSAEKWIQRQTRKYRRKRNQCCMFRL